MLREIFDRITPTCQEATRLLSESMDRRLPLRTRLSLALHILICRGCKTYQRQLLLIRGMLPESQDLSRLSTNAKERLKQAFRAKRE